MKDITEGDSRYLAFRLAENESDDEGLKIKEILGQVQTKKISTEPGFMKEVINLHDKVVPIINLKQRSTIPSIDGNKKPCVIIVDVNTGFETIQVGIIVNSISEVLNRYS